MNSKGKLSTSSPQSAAGDFIDGLKSNRQALMQRIKSGGNHAHNQIPQHNNIPSDSQQPFTLTHYMKMLLKLKNFTTTQYLMKLHRICRRCYFDIFV